MYQPSAITEESNPAAAGGHDGVTLPLDVVFDILVRLPAKDICRLRAVCRHWSSLTSDPVFVEAHARRHPPSPPLVVASFHGDGDHLHVMDLLSGRVLRRVPVANGQTLVRSFSRLDLVCVADRNGSSCSVINPATGDVFQLPETQPKEHYPPAAPEGGHWFRGPVSSGFTIGRVESTGEYKVLRLSSQDFKHDDDDDVKHLMISSSVLTLNNASAGQSRWRSTGRPNFLVDMDTCAVVGGTAYLLWSADNKDLDEHQREGIFSYFAVLDCIACFDLGTEEWTSIESPPLGEDDPNVQWEEDRYIQLLEMSTLVELKGNLAMAVYYDFFNSLQLWLLTCNINNRPWEFGYCVLLGPLVCRANPRTMCEKPLLVLDDGRIAIFCCHRGALLLYDDPSVLYNRIIGSEGIRHSVVEAGRLHQVGLYTGSVLSLFQSSFAKVY